MHDKHLRCNLAKNTDDLKDAYVAWTPTYDKDVMSAGYKAPLRVPELAMEYVRATEAAAAGAPVRVLDAGCGTGLTTDILRRLLSFEQIEATVVGVDLSAAMLGVATARGVYDAVLEHDLNRPLRGHAPFDLVLSTGLFLEGHCGPRAMANCLAALHAGGVAIVSVRQDWLRRAAAEYHEVIADAGCAIESNRLLPYLGPIEANFIVIRKQP